MSSRDRERFERTGQVFRGGKLVDVAVAQKVGAKVLQHYSTDKKVEFLSESLRVGKLSPSKLRESLERFAPREMRKGADKLIKKGKAVTVDNLLEEYHKDNRFQKVASDVGLDESWFVALAERECDRRKEKA